MLYELTEKGEKYLEKLPMAHSRLVERLSRDPKEVAGTFRSWTLHKPSRRLFLLRRIRRGVDPIQGALDRLEKGPGKKKSIKRLERELESMKKAGLITVPEETPDDAFFLEGVYTDRSGRKRRMWEGGS